MDLFIGFTGIIVTAILFFPVAIFIKMDSQGSIFYTQKRVGENGREFTLYKFRTLLNGKEKLWRELDPGQMTRLGAFLRKTTIDESPQFINLIKGDLTLIGPRSDWVVLARKLEDEIPRYKERYKITPGLIGLAQVSMPPPYSLQEYRERLRYDFDYIENKNLLMDLKIIFKAVSIFIRQIVD